MSTQPNPRAWGQALSSKTVQESMMHLELQQTDAKTKDGYGTRAG